MIAHNVFVAVPIGTNLFRRRVLGTAEDLHEPDAPLDQPPREQALPPERPDIGVVEFIRLACRSTLTVEVHRIGGTQLQSRGEFIRRDASFEQRVTATLGMGDVELSQKLASVSLGSG